MIGTNSARPGSVYLAETKVVEGSGKWEIRAVTEWSRRGGVWRMNDVGVVQRCCDWRDQAKRMKNSRLAMFTSNTPKMAVLAATSFG